MPIVDNIPCETLAIVAVFVVVGCRKRRVDYSNRMSV